MDLGLLVGGVAVLARPELTSAEIVSSPEPRFQMNLRGNEGTTYTIEYSTNLTTWDTLTNVVGASSGVSIVDTNVNGANQRFYRALDPQ